MTRQEFAGVMHAFNAAAQRHPPPPSFTSGRMATLILCTGASILCSVGLAIYYTHHVALLLGIPFSFVVLSSILVAWHRRLKVQVKTIAAYIPLQPPCTLLIVTLIVSFIFSIALLHVGAHTYVSLNVLFYIYALA